MHRHLLLKTQKMGTGQFQKLCCTWTEQPPTRNLHQKRKQYQSLTMRPDFLFLQLYKIHLIIHNILHNVYFYDNQAQVIKQPPSQHAWILGLNISFWVLNYTKIFVQKKVGSHLSRKVSYRETWADQIKFTGHLLKAILKAFAFAWSLP